MTPEERMARAEALAAEHERHDVAMDNAPWVEVTPGLLFADGPDPIYLGSLTKHIHATGLAALRNAAPEVAAVLRGLVADLRSARQALDRAVTIADEAFGLGPVEPPDATMSRIERGIFDQHKRISELERELADLRAQVVNALSAAGPGEDERTA